MSDLELLRTLGDQLAPPPLDSLRTVARRRARRQAAAVALATSLVVGAVATAALVLDRGAPDSAPPPVDRLPVTDTARPLTYAVGGKIHYGDRTLQAAARVAEVDLTDAGVALRTVDGRIWFTDGSTTDEIGRLGDPVEPEGELERWLPHFRYVGPTSVGWIVSGNSGSRLMWFDFVDRGAPEIVVYDTATRELVLRAGVDIPPGSWAGPHSVTDEAAYLFLDPEPFADDQLPQVRVDLSTGAQSRVSPRDYLADVGSRPARSMLVSHSEEGFELYEIIEGPGHQFDVHRGRLRPSGMQPIAVRDGLTGDRLAMRAPDGYPDTNPIWLTQWLDDRSVGILDPTGEDDRLLVCPVPAGTCVAAATGTGRIVVPDVSWP